MTICVTGCVCVLCVSGHQAALQRPGRKAWSGAAGEDGAFLTFLKNILLSIPTFDAKNRNRIAFFCIKRRFKILTTGNERLGKNLSRSHVD